MSARTPVLCPPCRAALCADCRARANEGAALLAKTRRALARAENDLAHARDLEELATRRAQDLHAVLGIEKEARP